MVKKKYKVWVGNRSFIVTANNSTEIMIKYPMADQIERIR